MNHKTSGSSIPLRLTAPHPCSYLSNQIASTAFVDPAYQITPFLFSRLAEVGFRRSGEYLYRPQCEHCQACTPIRIPVQAFHPTRNQKRCLKRNEDLHVRALDDINTTHCYELYARYLSTRHHDGDMYPPTREQYENFLCHHWPGTFYLGFYDAQETLLGISVCDRFTHGLSAVYTFYEPTESARSLGVYAVLTQIVHARWLQLPYLYLGYWIRDCRKMAYKTQYAPYELLHDGVWQTATPE